MAFDLKEAIDQAVSLYIERADINDQLKALKDAVEANGHNSKLVFQYAQAQFKERTEELAEDNTEMARIIEMVSS